MKQDNQKLYLSSAKRYTKLPGRILPDTPFKKGDIIVYEDKEGGVESIIIIDYLENERHGDIHYHTAISFQYPCKNLEAPACFYNSEKIDWRNWFVGDSIRKPTIKEMRFFLDAVMENLPTGVDIHKEIKNNLCS